MKGCFMAILTAINFANILMNKIKDTLSDDIAIPSWFTNQYTDYGSLMTFIFVLKGSQAGVLDFLHLCDRYDEKYCLNPTKSLRRFFQKPSVKFWDKKVTSSGCRIGAELFRKLTSPRFTSSVYILCSPIRNLNFFWIKLICTGIKDYWQHANTFVHHYVKHDYGESRFKEMGN